MFRTTAATPKLEHPQRDGPARGGRETSARSRGSRRSTARRGLHGPALLAESDARVLAALPLGSGPADRRSVRAHGGAGGAARAAPGAAARARRPDAPGGSARVRRLLHPRALFARA